MKKLVPFNGGSRPMGYPKSAAMQTGHILIQNWAGNKTLCGRAYPGVQGEVAFGTNNLYLCGTCDAVLHSKTRKGEHL